MWIVKNSWQMVNIDNGYTMQTEPINNPVRVTLTISEEEQITIWFEPGNPEKVEAIMTKIINQMRHKGLVACDLRDNIRE